MPRNKPVGTKDITGTTEYDPKDIIASTSLPSRKRRVRDTATGELVSRVVVVVNDEVDAVVLDNAPRIRFRSKSKKLGVKPEYDHISFVVYQGEKQLLAAALDDVEHDYSTLTDFLRDAVNSKLKSFGVGFSLKTKV